MKQSVIDYLVSKVIEDIRQGRAFGSEFALVLQDYSLNDSLRSAVQAVDIPILMKMAKSDQLVVGNLAISLLQKFHYQEDVKQFFLEEWDLSESVERRMQLMWRILDDPKLILAMHEKIYSFVNDNWIQFTADIKLYGGSDKILEFCRTRLLDSKFPKSKAWAYICLAFASSERDSALQLASEHASSDDVFVSKVSNDLLKRFGQNPT